jgi:hypothetical protein
MRRGRAGLPYPNPNEDRAMAAKKKKKAKKAKKAKK